MSYETIFYKAFAYTESKTFYPWEKVSLPSSYFVDGNLVGLGYVHHLIHIKPDWMITLATFIHAGLSPFNKILYLYHDKTKNQFNRCHSYYVDNEDIDKGGGTQSEYSPDEIIASLINHAEASDETNCIGCKGEHPLQSHLIQLLVEY